MHKTEGGFVKLNHPDTEKSGAYSLTLVEVKLTNVHVNYGCCAL